MGEKLELELDDARLRIPWGGHSPRSLTECGKLFILGELPTGGPIDGSPEQMAFFLQGGSNAPTGSRFKDSHGRLWTKNVLGRRDYR